MQAMPTILIIDDETGLVSSLTFALEEEGYKVYSAATGESGLQAIADLHPDLVRRATSHHDLRSRRYAGSSQGGKNGSSRLSDQAF